MWVKWFLLFFAIAYIEAQYTSRRLYRNCPHPNLLNGKSRVRLKTRMVKYMCQSDFELVGNRYSSCRNGKWDEPVPVCVKPGCPTLPTPEQSIQTKAHHDAWVTTFCWPGFKLVGSRSIYCDGNKWNATSPSCVDDTISNEGSSLSCDFETADICGWTQDDYHDFDWKRHNLKTPSSFLNTGPSFDHTYGKGNSGYYMYIESTSKRQNNTARLLSPIYEARLAEDGCFTFFYHMYGSGVGGLRVYQKPDFLTLNDVLDKADKQYLLFEQWGNLGDFWFSAAGKLVDHGDNFQIVIEGVRGINFMSDIAVDDVAILQGQNCTNFRNAATTPSPIVSETCAGRCNVARSPESVRDCECTSTCLDNDHCCPDYIELCVNFPATDSDEYSSSDAPQTEKLVGITNATTTSILTQSTTIPTTILTTKPTTKLTPKPIPPQPTTKPTTKLTTKTTTKLTTKPTPKPTTKSTTVKITTTTKRKPSTKTMPTTKIMLTTKAIPKLTTKRVVTTEKTTTKATTAVTTVKPSTGNATRPDKDKLQKEMNIQKVTMNKSVTNNPSSRNIAAIVITLLVLGVFIVIAYLVLYYRTPRGRMELAKIRGRWLSTDNSEVRYLSAFEGD